MTTGAWRLATMLALLALFATACTAADEGTAPTAGETTATDAEPTADEATTEPTETEAAEAGQGGTLVVAVSSDPGNFNPAITTSGGTHTASEVLYNGLLRFDENLEPVPDLAAEMPEITDDGATYTFTLRDDVVWHDGEPFTSEDVKFTFDNMLLQFHSRTSASLGGALESIETPDDQTVVFNFQFPYAPLLQQLDVTEAPILPAHYYEGVEDIENAPENLEPIGTGPFKFVSYEPDSEIRFEANTDYFKPGLPIFGELVMQVIPEDANQVIALEAGEVDWLWDAPGPELERLRATGDYEFLQTSVNPGGSNCIMTVSFNLDRPILQDQAVREAFAYAIDRQVYLDRILFGSGQVAEAPISSGIPFAHADDLEGMPQYDPERANQILDEAGWVRDGEGVRTAQGVEGVEDGTPLALNFLSFPTFSDYGDLLREQLREVGIDLMPEAVERAAFIERVFTGRDFDTNIISYCNQSDPEIGVRRMYISSNIQPIPFSNSSAYSNPQIDELFDQAREEVDQEARSELYRQIQEILVADLPYFWIVETEGTRVYRAECEGFQPFGHFAEAASCNG